MSSNVASSLAPLRNGKGVAQMLTDAPHLAAYPPHVQRVAAWSYRYIEDPVPDRDDIMRQVTVTDLSTAVEVARSDWPQWRAA